MEDMQRQLQEVSGQNEQLVARLAMLELAAAATPLPTSPPIPEALVDTRLMQLNTFEGDEETWADWAFTFRAYAAAASTDIAKVLARMRKARTAVAGRGAEAWRRICLECRPEQRRRFQAMLANVLRAALVIGLLRAYLSARHTRSSPTSSIKTKAMAIAEAKANAGARPFVGIGNDMEVYALSKGELKEKGQGKYKGKGNGKG